MLTTREFTEPELADLLDDFGRRAAQLLAGTDAGVLAECVKRLRVPAAPPLTAEQRLDLQTASFCVASVGDPSATLSSDIAERIIGLLDEIAGEVALVAPTQAPAEARNLGNHAATQQRQLTPEEQAARDDGKKFERLAGRGSHELRAEELPAYLMHLADGYADGPHMDGYYGARRAELNAVAAWIASELIRKTNDERVIAVQLANLRAAEKPLSDEEIDNFAYRTGARKTISGAWLCGSEHLRKIIYAAHGIGDQP